MLIVNSQWLKLSLSQTHFRGHEGVGGIAVRKKEKVRNRYNQVPHLTQNTTWERDKTQENITHKKAKRPAISQQVTTRLQKQTRKHDRYETYEVQLLNYFLFVLFSASVQGICVVHNSTDCQSAAHKLHCGITGWHVGCVSGTHCVCLHSKYMYLHS